MRSLLVLIVAASLGLLACEGPNPTLSATAESVEIGTGEEAFALVPDGTVLTGVYGGQGGRHVWGSVRLDGFSVTGGPPLGGVGMQMEFGIEHPEGLIASVGPLTANVNAASGEFTGATVILEFSPWLTPFLYPSEYEYGTDSLSLDDWEEIDLVFQAEVEADLRMWVEVEDSDGNVLEDECIIGIEGLRANGY